MSNLVSLQRSFLPWMKLRRPFVRIYRNRRFVNMNLVFLHVLLEYIMYLSDILNIVHRGEL